LSADSIWAPHKLIAIGASTGGTEAIKTVLSALPRDLPGIVIAQHMPPAFTASFALRLASVSKIKVIEAQDGDAIVPGHAYLAPGHAHLKVKRTVSGYMIELWAGDPVNRYRPSVDTLFNSVAIHAGMHAIGIILTGMGKDGALGLLTMRRAGAWTIGQDEHSCVVYGMPREAAALGALEEVVPLAGIADRILARLR
jgi:two-component system chemotaxis response regulator CheB